jgi:hypothetical protein
MRFFRFEPQPDVNSLNDQNIVLQLYFAHGLRDQALVRCTDLTRLQRAPKGSRKSTGGCGDNVVQGCGMRFQHVRWNFVMFRHRAMNSEDHWLLLGRQVCSADRAPHAFDAYMRSISHVRHDCGIVSRYSSPVRHGTASATLPSNARKRHNQTRRVFRLGRRRWVFQVH